MTTPLLLQVRPARAAGARDLPALETALAGLALDERSPIALEIAATATTRQFLLRAEQPVALRYLAQQVQARYPQAMITPAPADPLVLAPDEACSVIELRPGAASYLPLRSWKPRDLLAEGTDPLLGILAAFGSLPVGTRAVAQLALLPASPTWSANNRRYAVEHPLHKERTPQPSGGIQEKSLKDVLVLLPVVVVSLLLYAFHQKIPPWLIQAAVGLLRGQTPHLTGAEALALILGSVSVLVLLVGGMFVAMSLARRFGQTRIYDQRLAEEKTARSAYKVRLRLLVIAPGSTGASPPARSWWLLLQALLHRTGSILSALPDWRSSLVLLLAAFQYQRLRLHSWRTLVLVERTRRVERDEVLRMIAAAYRQYHLASGGYFLLRRLSSRHTRKLLAPPKRGWFRQAGWACDLPHSAHVLSVADLAALWHLPQAQDLPDLAFVEHHTMRSLLAPSVLSIGGQGYQLGTSTHAGQTLPVFLPVACLRQNILAAASTGKGKSTLFVHLLQAFAQARVRQQTDAPDGVLLIDPHGDLAAQVAGNLPPELADDILLINLADRSYPIAFNPLDMSGGRDRDTIIDHLIQVIEALWPTSYGPRTESFLEYSCKTLAEANEALIAADPTAGPDRQYTLLDVVPLFRQTSFRNAVLQLVNDPALKSWWHQYYELLDARQQSDFTSSLFTKIAKFSSTKVLSRILGQPRSSLDLTEMIQQHKIILFSCASGEIGADMAALFGSLFVGFFQSALAEQARLRPEERHRFLVLIDEFQALAGINYQTMLAELRKYGGSFALATQSLAYLDRLDRTLRATVLANSEHLFAFAMADEDARLLCLPGVEPEDVTQLPNYTCYVRLALDGARLPVFSLHLDAPAAGNMALQQRVVALAQARSGRAVGEVEQILHQCQARRNGAPDWNAAGWEPVDLTGVESVPEAIERINKRKRGSGGAKKEPDQPQHVMFEADEADEGEGEE